MIAGEIEDRGSKPKRLSVRDDGMIAYICIL